MEEFGCEKQSVKRKIGIMGGTFNPIHIGHLILAETAYEQMHLDKVWMMPNAMPPHKSNQNILSLKHRLKMIELAIFGNEHFEISRFELEACKHYSYETMEALIQMYPDTEFYYIMGADSLLDIEKWVEYRRFLSTCHVLVADRQDERNCTVVEKKEQVERDYNCRVTVLSCPCIEISSSDIRNRRLEGKSIRYQVSDKVFEYICKEHLYEGKN